jgi:hypothetical protein
MLTELRCLADLRESLIESDTFSDSFLKSSLSYSALSYFKIAYSFCFGMISMLDKIKASYKEIESWASSSLFSFNSKGS